MNKYLFFNIALILLILIVGLTAASDSKANKNNFLFKTELNKENITRVILEMKDGTIQSTDLNRKNTPDMESDDSIENIYIDYPIKADLYESSQLISAPDSWKMQINGYNLTGAGQTICIIDTGIDYTNSNLVQNYLTGYDFVNNDSDPLDDNGHGTHIAGIIASNGVLKGIAPNAKIVSIKVLDSDGKGYSSDVIKGIDWCTNNSENLNISSIVLSLSTDCSLNPSSCSFSFCGSSPFYNSIARATSKNIIVLAATGNSGLSDTLPSPACVRNATPIAASDKQDSLWLNSNRNSLVRILAPGKEIYSTYLNSYKTLSGTSMAVPHVAGAVAILKQFLVITNETRMPSQIDEILFNSGKSINDPVSNLNFSRLDIKKALLSLDNQKPDINLAFPKYRESTKNGQNFSCIARDWQISKINFLLFNQSENSSNLIYNSSMNFSGEFAQLNISVQNLSHSHYIWECSADDANGNLATSENKSLFIVDIASNLISPEDNSITGNESIFLCKSESNSNLGLMRTTLFIWSDKLLNESIKSNESENSSNLIYNYSINTTGVENVSYFNYNFTDEGEYQWNCLVEDNKTQVFSSVNYSIEYNSSFISNQSVQINVSIPNAQITSSGSGDNNRHGSAVKIINKSYSNTTKIKTNESKDVSIAERSENIINKSSQKEKEGEAANTSYLTGAVIGYLGKSGPQIAIIFLTIIIIVNIMISRYVKKIKNRSKM